MKTACCKSISIFAITILFKRLKFCKFIISLFYNTVNLNIKYYVTIYMRKRYYNSGKE